MKQLQISEALFVKMIKYFYSEEIGFDNEEIFDLEREIKKELQMKLDRQNTKPQKRSRSVRKHARNISMKKECRKASGGDFP